MDEIIVDVDDTSGFYRVDEDVLWWAPNAVWAPTYTLLREEHETYTYPTEGGWIWCNTVAAAELHFNKKMPTTTEDKSKKV
jgi:hypothetical protein